MLANSADLEALKQFASQMTRSVLVAPRKACGLQTSPRSLVADDDGNILTATRPKNAETDSLFAMGATLCLFNDQ
jgi:hypothetical protein